MGPPMALAGPANPGGAWCICLNWTDLSIYWARPTPPEGKSPIRLVDVEGGASADMLTMFSPRRITSPNARFYSRYFSPEGKIILTNFLRLQDSELLGVSKNHIHVLIKSQESSDQHPRVLDRDSNAIVNPLEEFALSSIHLWVFIYKMSTSM